jgi:hypothetical protein
MLRLYSSLPLYRGPTPWARVPHRPPWGPPYLPLEQCWDPALRRLYLLYSSFHQSYRRHRLHPVPLGLWPPQAPGLAGHPSPPKRQGTQLHTMGRTGRHPQLQGGG